MELCYINAGNMFGDRQSAELILVVKKKNS